MTFEQQCSQAASRFLQTAVLVDDRAEFQQATAVDDGDDDDVGDFQEPLDLAAAPIGEAVAQARRENLDAGAITKGFAEKGLICSVLKPVGEGTIEKDVIRLAPRSDIIVLDWQMGDTDNGDIALRIIKSVLMIDRRFGGRLRLFAIYTGVRDLQTVADRIAEQASSLTAGEDLFEFFNDTQTTKVVILGKGTPEDHENGQGGRCAEEGGLAERLIAEFARFSGGILRNATLASMGYLRDNTHRLLARLNGSLDAPLVTHFALVGSPQDSQQYVADLILQEIEAQVPLNDIVAEYAGSAAMKARIAKVYADGKHSRIVLNKTGTTVRDIPKETAKALIDGPTAALTPHFEEFATELQLNVDQMPKLFAREQIAKKLYCVLGDTFEEGLRKHEDFAIASGIRLTNSGDFESKLLPTVRLGTVIHDEEHYYVCLTPVCDSVRLRGKRANFLFGRLIEHQSKFNFIIDDRSERKRLFIDRKDPVLRTFELLPGADETIRVQKKNFYIDYAVPLADTPGVVRWVAEIKPMQAQRVVGSITSNLARIGLDEFEWLRHLAENWSG